jgi:transposase-like protein
MEQKGVPNPPASEGARRATGDDGGAAARKPQRFSAKMKSKIVLRLLRGEDLELLSREYGTTAAQISHWRDEFLRGGEAAMKRREEPESEGVKRLREKLGEVTMDSELLREKIRRLESNNPLPRGRSRR